MTKTKHPGFAVRIFVFEDFSQLRRSGSARSHSAHLRSELRIFKQYSDPELRERLYLDSYYGELANKRSKFTTLEELPKLKIRALNIEFKRGIRCEGIHLYSHSAAFIPHHKEFGKLLRYEIDNDIYRFIKVTSIKPIKTKKRFQDLVSRAIKLLKEGAWPEVKKLGEKKRKGGER